MKMQRQNLLSKVLHTGLTFLDSASGKSRAGPSHLADAQFSKDAAMLPCHAPVLAASAELLDSTLLLPGSFNAAPLCAATSRPMLR